MAEEKLGYGLKVLDSKLGVRAHQFRAPWLLLSKGGPLQEDEGEVFGGSLAWSGSFRFAFEVLPNGELQTLCGVNPFASAYKLAPGEAFETPKMIWAWSDRGAGDLSRKLHRYIRREVIRDGDEPRAVLLNNWESTYFDFDEGKIVSLFEGAREIGLDLFLLDDGWFGQKYPRNDDTQGLGDWTPDPRKLPNGIGALTRAAKEKGLRFGLWFEPEMVNPRSELFEKHPEWLIRQPKRQIELQRNQMVLDLTNPEVREFVFDVIEGTLSRNPGISYIKWDCNRYITQPGSPYLHRDMQENLQVDYVRGLYAVMEKVATSYPDVQIMMCSGGGGRVDLGAMRFAHELWPSDMTDPVRRLFIQWGFSYFMPAIAVANHVTLSGESSLKFAFDVAFSGRLGMDVDLDKLSKADREVARSAVAVYKEIRELVQLGDLYRLESPYAGPRSSLMYVKENGAVVFLYSLGDSPPACLRLKGIVPSCSYSVREINVATEGLDLNSNLSGRALIEGGLPVPALGPCESAVFHLERPVETGP